MPTFIENFDLAILRAVDALNVPFLDWLAQALSLLCEHGIFPVLLALALLVPKRTRRAGVTMLAALLLSLVFTNLLLKPLVARPRPYVLYEFEPNCILPHDLSFPSGHASASFAAAVGFARSKSGFKKWAVAGLVVASLISLSRIWLTVHYPSDVICGALIGIVCGFVAGALVGWLYPKILAKISKKGEPNG